MAVLYVDEYGAMLRYSAGLVVVEKNSKTVAGVRVGDLEKVVIGENAAISSAVITELLSQGIDISFLDKRGDYVGRVETVLNRDISLRRRSTRLLRIKHSAWD